MEYAHPDIPPGWAWEHNCHPAIAHAIHAISDELRTPEEIWRSATFAEQLYIAAAIAQYVTEETPRYREEPAGYVWDKKRQLTLKLELPVGNF